MSKKIAEQLARLAAPKLFRKTDKAIAPITAILERAFDAARDDERQLIRRQLKEKPPPQEVIDWALRQLARQGLKAWLSKLARPDPAAAALITSIRKIKLLEAASRVGLARAKKGDDQVLARWYQTIATRRKAMATNINFTFDARGLPATFNASSWDNAVNTQLAAIGLPQTGNEVAYAAIKGVLLLNEQYDETATTFRDGLRAAWDEVMIQSDAVPTRNAKGGPNITAYQAVAPKIPVVAGRTGTTPTVYFQELAFVSRFVITRSADVPLDDNNFDSQVRIGLDQYVSGAPVFESLALPALGDDGQIVTDNIRAVGTLAACYYLEKLRLIDVLDRVTEVFLNGMLPIGFDSAGRALNDYYWSRQTRMTSHDRMAVYSRVLGVPGGDISKEVQPNKDYDPTFNRFIASISEYDRQRRVAGVLTAGPGARPLTSLGENVRKTGNDVARNATLYGYAGSQFSARMTTDAIQTAVRILSLPSVLRSYGVNSPYQVIERVAANDWHVQVSVVKYKTSADVVKAVFDLIAKYSGIWSQTTGRPLFTDQGITGDLDSDQEALFSYAQQWLAVNGMQDQQVEKLSEPVESKPGASLPLLTGATGGNGLDTIAKLQQMVTSGSAPSLDQLRQLLPAGNA